MSNEFEIVKIDPWEGIKNWEGRVAVASLNKIQELLA
jgi:hypothetical protein